MLKYSGSGLIRFGCLGTVLVVLFIGVGLNAAKAIEWMTTVTYRADFTEAAGISPGSDVLVSGVLVGSVQGVDLVEGKARVSFSVHQDTRLGDTTAVQIRTGSLLGQRVLTVEPSGDGTLSPTDLIPVTRTASPYSLNQAVDDLTTNTSGIDTDTLNRSLTLMSSTMRDVAPDMAPTLDGLSELARGINERNGTLRDLLDATGEVSGVIASRASRVNSLILNANQLVGVLSARRQNIASLLANTTVVAEQLSRLVAENEKQLGPTLDSLNSVAAMLERNRDNIGKALPGLAKVAQTQGEAVSAGPFYQAYVANLIPGPLIQPFLDTAFGLDGKTQRSGGR